jgi:cobalt-precorrin-5B (C1)-methyltransferase
MGKTLRSGYTTGACAAAAAKAAALAMFQSKRVRQVEIVFPDDSMVEFEVIDSRFAPNFGAAGVIKDAGDDPDVTNGAIIEAEVSLVKRSSQKQPQIEICGGTGVGLVTKPGLAVAVGEPAINPVPQKMIRQNVAAVFTDKPLPENRLILVEIIVPNGEVLAEKTLNARLGIVGGISILGTTGIVRPISTEAWTMTISSSMDVAAANGVEEIILSTGRTSERCIQKLLKPPEEALVMMGDYLDFSLHELHKHRFSRVHVATMWAKLLKGAMGHGQTHVRHGVIDKEQICEFFLDRGIDRRLVEKIQDANTAREILDRLITMEASGTIHLICDYAARRYRSLAGIDVTIHLVNGSGKLICSRMT